MFFRERKEAGWATPDEAGAERRPRSRSGCASPARVGVWTSCPPHVHRLRASLACLPSPTASGGDREWTRRLDAGAALLVDGLGDCCASCRKIFFWDSCHAMHGTGGWAACLLRLHCYFFFSPSSLLIYNVSVE